MSITNKLNQIKNAIYGKEVRGAIHDAIKECYDDASVNHDNANMEVKMARGTHNTLNDRLDNVDEIQAQTNAQLSQIPNTYQKKETSGHVNQIVDIAKGHKGKCVVINNNDSFEVFTPTHKEYIKWVLKRDVVMPQQSVGGDAELTRMLACYRGYNKLYSIIPFSKGVTTGTWSSVNNFPSPTYTEELGMKYIYASSIGSKITFNNVRGRKLNIALMSRPIESAGRFKVTVNGEDKGTYFCQNESTEVEFTILELPIVMSKKLNKVELELIEENGKRLYIFGIQAFDLKSENAEFSDEHSIMMDYNHGSVTNMYYSNGANDYAIQCTKPSSNSYLWCGSYHGGETLLSPMIVKLDGATTDLSKNVYVCDNIEFFQKTTINHTNFTDTNIMNINSVIKFDKTGYYINYKMTPLQDIKIKLAYVAMACNSNSMYDSVLFDNGYADMDNSSHDTHPQESMGVIHFKKGNANSKAACNFIYNWREAFNQFNDTDLALFVRKESDGFNKSYFNRIDNEKVISVGDTWNICARHVIVDSNPFYYL